VIVRSAARHRTSHQLRCVSLILALAATLSGSACGDQPEPGSTPGGRLYIATGNTTGVYYQLGGGYADLISAHMPGWRATAEATGASADNIERVVRGDADIAFTLADTAGDAAVGRGLFSAPQPIRALARIYTNYTHVIVRADRGISTIAELRARRVSTGSPNSGTENIALRILRAAGLDPDRDVHRLSLSLPETVRGMRDGTVDALFWSGGLPTAGITDLVAAVGSTVDFLPLGAVLPVLQGEFGQVYQPAILPGDTYHTGVDVPTIGVPNLLVVKDTMPNQLAHELTQVLFENLPEIAQVHPEGSNISRADGPLTGPVPLHPGAEEYFTMSPPR
jgi:TRAP transporter TAXI family solute receptor